MTTPNPDGLADFLRLGMPLYADIDAANAEVLRLTVENMRLRGEIDRQKLLTLYDEVGHE